MSHYLYYYGVYTNVGDLTLMWDITELLRRLHVCLVCFYFYCRETFDSRDSSNGLGDHVSEGVGD